MNKNRKKQVKPEQSMVGKIIDLPLEDFKREVEEQHLNVGMTHNVRLSLVGIYNDLCVRKDKVIELVTTKQRKNDDPEVVKVLNGLYAEMLKVEEKVTFLTEREERLLKAGN